MTHDRPWMTALEMQFATLRNARTMGSHSTPADRIAAEVLAAAVPFAWSRDVSAAVWLASRTIPEDATLSDAVFPDRTMTCWWWFDSPLPIPMAHGQQIDGCDTTTISGLLLHYQIETNVLIVVDARATLAGPLLTGLHAVKADAKISEIKTDPISSARALSLARFIVAATVWMNQRILIYGTGHIERHRRKQLAREHNNSPIPSDVKVIQLRRTESQPRENSDTEHRDWNCRWIVGGHWRNQPYKDGRKLIYILPYVKGPDDKPLKVPTHTVYQVSR